MCEPDSLFVLLYFVLSPGESKRPSCVLMLATRKAPQPNHDPMTARRTAISH